MILKSQCDIDTKNQLLTRGIAFVDGVVAEDICDSLLDRIDTRFQGDWKSVSGVAPEEDNPGAPYPPEIMDEGEEYHYRFVDSYKVVTQIPEVMRLYLGLLPYIRDAFGMEAVPSPYPKSQVLVVDYRREGDCQGRHRDTQPLTVGLYLTDSESGSTEAVDHAGAVVRIKPVKGRLLLMHGRHVGHRSLPLARGDRKVFLPLNYYTLSDFWRPETLDSEDYWG